MRSATNASEMNPQPIKSLTFATKLLTPEPLKLFAVTKQQEHRFIGRFGEALRLDFRKRTFVGFPITGVRSVRESRR
jgi:hypothetical protein